MKHAVMIALAVFGLAQGDAPAQDPEEAYTGQQVYQLFCLACHGLRGEGSPLGKSLIDELAKSKSDADIIKVITEGRPQQGMMAFGGALSRDEIAKVMTFIREMQGMTAEAVVGGETAEPTAAGSPISAETVARGEAVFREAGCFQCHSYYNDGGFVGPNLDKLMLRLTPEQMREAVENPSASIVEGFEGKVVTPKESEPFTTRFRRETKESIQLLHDRGMLWKTHLKGDLASVEDSSESIMPAEAFGKLSEDDKAALLAFLETLR